jgi:hypothetical protein
MREGWVPAELGVLSDMVVLLREGIDWRGCGLVVVVPEGMLDWN